MLFTSIAALLFPIAIMAAPANKPAAGDHQCPPIAYTVTEYTRTIGPDHAFISFNVQSDYTVYSDASDPVKAGVNCEVDGPFISPLGQFQCNKKGEKLEELIFTLRATQDVGRYRIHHKWQCNGATWESINKVDFPPCNLVEDGTNGDTVKCTIKPFIFVPQNVSKLADDDKKAVKAAKPTAKPTACSKPPKCDA